MGCCQTQGKVPQENIIIDKLKGAIEANSPEKIAICMGMLQKLSKGTSFTVDSPIFVVKEVSLNSLAYATTLGNAKAFKCLYEEFKASVVEMEKILLETEITSLDIICQKGYTELLLYYIPIYLQFNTSFPNAKPNNLTMDFDKTVEATPRNIYTPVQKACDLGNISILISIHNYFKNKQYKPYTLDIDYQEETSGENCFLIACRNGNYQMIKFLFEVVKTDPSVKNKNGESAINICLAACKRNPNRIYLECLIYLIEVAKVDIKYQHEESLLLAQDKEIIQYIERQLKNLGIKTDKQSVEKINIIKQMPIPKSDLEVQLDDQNEFNIRDYVGDDMDRSALSSIANFESQLEPFISVLGNNLSILKPAPK